MMLTLAAIIGVSSSLGYLLPAIIGLESMGIPSPGETALVLAAVLASQGKLQIELVHRDRDRLGDHRRQHSATSSGASSAARCSRPRAVPAPPRCSVIRAGDRSSSGTAARRCSSRAGSRSCASRPRGWPGSTRCRSRSVLLLERARRDHLGDHLRARRLLRRPRGRQRTSARSACSARSASSSCSWSG